MLSHRSSTCIRHRLACNASYTALTKYWSPTKLFLIKYVFKRCFINSHNCHRHNVKLSQDVTGHFSSPTEILVVILIIRRIVWFIKSKLVHFSALDIDKFQVGVRHEGKKKEERNLYCSLRKMSITLKRVDGKSVHTRIVLVAPYCTCSTTL